jgi:hypothetical protein
LLTKMLKTKLDMECFSRNIIIPCPLLTSSSKRSYPF